MPQRKGPSHGGARKGGASGFSENRRQKGDYCAVKRGSVKSGLGVIYFILCLVPWIILPGCFGPSEIPFWAPLGRALAGLLVEYLSALLATLGLIAAAFAPRGSKIGLLIAAAVASIPGFWLLPGIPN